MISTGHHFVRLTAAVLLCLLLTACGGEGDGKGESAAEGSTSAGGSSNTVQQDVWVQGYAVKGAIESGLVSLWRQQPGAQSDIWVQVTDAIRTRYDGRFRVLVPAEFAQQPLKVVLHSDTQTLMRCDMLPACRTPTGTSVAFGDWFWPGNDLMFASLMNPEEANSSIVLTPLGTLAFQEYIQSGANGYAGYAAALKQQERRFGLAAGALLRKPVDLASADLSKVDARDLNVALLNIAFLSLVGDERWNTLGDVLAEAQQRLSVNGNSSTNVAGALDSTLDSTLGMSVELVVLASLLQANYYEAQFARDGVQNAGLADTVQSLETLLLTAQKTVPEQAGPDFKPVPEPLAKPAPKPLPESSPKTTPKPQAFSLPGVQPKPELKPVTEPEPEAETETAPRPKELYGTATLSWQAPLSRENGNSLTMGEIGSYEVRYGLSADLESVNTSVQVEDGQRMSYTVEGLLPGTWYFAIQTVDIAGLKSEWSEVVSKVIK
jgi:hypothetical protein